MENTRAVLLAAVLTVLPVAAYSQGTRAPADAFLYIIWPPDGATVKGAFWCRFGLRNMGVTQAGSNAANSGHHHLLIDVVTLPDMTQPLPATEQIKHFGKGQTEAEVTLPPGKHTLQLVFANYLHIPHAPPVISKPITITVK